MENNKIEVISPKSIITIQLSGSFYKSVQNAMIHLSTYRESEDLGNLIEKINKQAPSEEFDDWEASMETLMILCAEVEEKAREQKCTEEMEIPSSNTTSEDPSL